MTSSPQQTGRGRKAALYVTVGVIAVGAVFLAGVKVIGAWTGTPFPSADPAATARRLDAQTQEVYDALALPGAALNPQWPGGGTEANIYDCHPRGLAHFVDNLADTQPREPGTAVISTEWALAGVTRPQALDALRRAKQALVGKGWTVTSHDEAVEDVTLRLAPPRDGDGVGHRVVVSLYPNGNLSVAAISECVRYPAGTRVTQEGAPYDLPDPVAPAQLRGR
ncbi:hypothetical protein [Streptomyces sp. CB01881]|uniref:hypothetical protein n=1 Tax=Streptomyces sp. CB01881 TaxID=2078691 RepID=UPI0011DFA26A|nr:hypothetical protein [Streptomyces sp. CB01881]TYC70529.1 hypothetical protein EH183_32360 [Streptomyces sp. CB01881]